MSPATPMFSWSWRTEASVTDGRWQLLPDLSDEEQRALKADIAAHGLRVPIVVDAASGDVVDGHHRQRAIEELRRGEAKVAD
jgi:ParB-like chromosome segregation protein Spo0J